MQNNITVWYNQYGEDDKYTEVVGVWSEEILNKIKESSDSIRNFEWIKDIEFEDFEEEERGEGWVMYAYEGAGVFVVEEGYDVDKCKKECDSYGD